MNISKIKNILDNFSEFSGVVQIIEDGCILMNASKGYAKRFDEIPNSITTSFGIASGTKGFTALAILKLIDDGKLSLSDDVFSLLPYNFPNIKERITVKHLLTHTSGIYDYFDEDILDDFSHMFKIVPINKMLGPADMLPLLTVGECYFSPGEKFKYCNSGFVILGILVEEVSAMKYSEYLDKHIINPLNLKGTGCFSTNQLPKVAAHGYIKNSDGSWVSNIFEIPLACTADGGLYTTTDDISKMWYGFINGSIISESLKELALSPHVQIHDDQYYGLGFYMQENTDKSIKKYYLVGSDPGVGFLSYYYPKEKRIITIISNANDTAWDFNRMIKEYID
ncbi:MAG: serine hydrolase domain-containing protein [Eubacteriales bacterium]